MEGIKINFWKNLFSSLDNHSLGYSGRKITTVCAIAAAYWLTYTMPEESKLYALYAWLGLALLCLGIVTFQQIVEFKNGKKDESVKNS